MNREETLNTVLDNYRLKFESGDKSALLEAVGHCAAYKIILPDWVAWHYTHSFSRWHELEVRTLDEAFEMKRPKSFNIAKERRIQTKSFDIAFKVIEKRKTGIAFDNGLADEIGKLFGTNSDAVYDSCKEMAKHPVIKIAFKPLEKK